MQRAFARVGCSIEWRGSGVAEQGLDADTGTVLVEVDPGYFRLTEVDLLRGDASKAKEKLGWEARITFEALVDEMVDSDLSDVKTQAARKNWHD